MSGNSKDQLNIFSSTFDEIELCILKTILVPHFLHGEHSHPPCSVGDLSLHQSQLRLTERHASELVKTHMVRL